MIELMKQLLNIDVSDTSKDALLEHFIEKAELNIKGYSCINLIHEYLNGVVIDYAVFLYRNSDAEGVKSQTQGERTATYEQGIPESIKSALPKPKVRVVK